MKKTIIFALVTMACLGGGGVFLACSPDPDPVVDEKWTVSFDPSGTGVTVTSPAIDNIEVSKGKSANAAGVTWPSKPTTSSNYGFGGWYVASDTTFTTEITADTTITVDMSLVARWLPLRTVSFDLNGTGLTGLSPSTINNIKVGDGKTAATWNNDWPTKPTATSEHGFEGWYLATDTAQTGTKYTDTTLITEDLELKAKWLELRTVTFSFDPDDTDVEGISPSTINNIKVGDGKTATEWGATWPTNPTATSDHLFDGWYEDTDNAFTTKITASTPITTNMDLVAKWRMRPHHEVLFDPTGDDVTLTSSESIEPIVVPEGKSATEADLTWPSDPASSTHDFGGWYADDDDSYTTAYTASSTITGPLSLVAKWTVKPGTTAPVKVGTIVKNVAVTASASATVDYIEGGYKVTTSANYGPFASFKVNLGTGKKIRDFAQVKFTYSAIQGDVGYKDIRLLVSDSAFPALSSDAFQNYIVSASYWGTNAGTEAIICNIGEVVGQTATTYVDDINSLSSANEIYVCVYLNATATGSVGGANSTTTFSVTDIEFVPAPAYVAVNSIFGVPSAAVRGEEVDLTEAIALPPIATNRTIVWSVKTAVTGVTVGELTGGKFTPTATGTVTVTATVENGLTASTPYTRDFDIVITGVPVEKTIALTLPTDSGEGKLGKDGYTGTLDVGGLGFNVTGGVNYQWTAAILDLNLGSATLEDVSKVKFSYTPVSGDTDYKSIYFAATTKNGVLSGNLSESANGCLGTVGTGGTAANTAKALEIELDYNLRKAITGSEVKVYFVVSAPSSANFKITDIKFLVAE